jgi:hypothetical protein
MGREPLTGILPPEDDEEIIQGEGIVPPEDGDTADDEFEDEDEFDDDDPELDTEV